MIGNELFNAWLASIYINHIKTINNTNTNTNANTNTNSTNKHKKL